MDKLPHLFNENEFFDIGLILLMKSLTKQSYSELNEEMKFFMIGDEIRIIQKYGEEA
jgi:hypothetical protein